jgi:hypothetical protein
MGAAYGTAKSGVGIASMGVMRPELVMKSIVPVVMAGVLGIYGLIIAVIISTGGRSGPTLAGLALEPAWLSLQQLECGNHSSRQASQSHKQLGAGHHLGQHQQAEQLVVGLLHAYGVAALICVCFVALLCQTFDVQLWFFCPCSHPRQVHPV